MKLLRNLFIIGTLVAVPVAAMWPQLRPHLGPLAHRVDEVVATLKAAFESAKSRATAGGTNDMAPGSPGTKDGDPHPRFRPQPLPSPAPNPLPGPPSLEDDTKATRRLELPIYRPMETSSGDRTIERRTSEAAGMIGPTGHDAARDAASEVTARLRELGAAGYSLRADEQTGHYHFEATFDDPSGPQPTRRFAATHPDGKAAMQQVLDQVQLWQGRGEVAQSRP